MNKNVLNNFIWKYIERCGYQGTIAVINIILARVLAPKYFGELAIINIVIVLAQSFVQNGVATALVREGHIRNADYINMGIACLIVAIILYIIIFMVAPSIAVFYDMPGLKRRIRLMGIILIPGAINSVENAKIIRENRYKKLCAASVSAAVLSGIVGVFMAYHGYGTDSLIWQQLSFRVLWCLTMMPITKIQFEKPVFDEKFKRMFQFGWKLMLSSFLNQTYTQIQSLAVGKKYDSATLGAYNQGSQYPILINQNINMSIQTVVLPEFSKNKNDYALLKASMKKVLTLSSYVISPLMIGLFAVADNFVDFVLTSKWESAVPYIRLFCLVYILTPLSTTNLQGYNAVGRSDIYLKNEVLKKIFGFVALAVALVFFESPISIAVGTVVSGCLACYVDMHFSHAAFKYTYLEQSIDVFANIGISAIMGLAVYCLNFLKLNLFITLFLQVLIGVAVYILLSVILKPPGYKYLIGFLQKRKKKQLQEE